MDISIIIVCFKGWDRLRKCLSSLEDFRDGHFTYEVIVVDNNSDDGVIDKVEVDYPGIRFVRSAVNGGFAYGCNLGASLSAGECLLFLNPDTVVTADAIKGLLDYARQNSETYIISCRQINENNRESRAFGVFPAPGTFTGAGRSLMKLFSPGKFRVNLLQEAMNPDWVSGSVMMMRKESFLRTAGFDTDYWMYYEDTDICRRVRTLGGRVAYLTGITIRHDHGGSSRINPLVTSITKAEVLISRHLYVSKHFNGSIKLVIQSWLVTVTLSEYFLRAVIGLLLFFVPQLFISVKIFNRLLEYYRGAIKSRSWISSRAVRTV